jgi:CRISPR-associated endonuclease Csy4
MKFYIEMTLLPSADIGINFLWAKLYQQIHLALVEMSDGKGVVPIGVSFSQYDADKYWFGDKLRFFAEAKPDLEKLNIKKWLDRLFDYVHITQIREVPDNIKSHVIYKRRQSNRSFSKLKRTIKRKAEREGVDMEEAGKRLIANLADGEGKKSAVDDVLLLKFPFIEMKSFSSDKYFKLFIAKEIASREVLGTFNCYGLSCNSTVPEF